MRPEKIEFTNKIPVRAFLRCVEQYPYHWHDTLEIVQVLKGWANISLGDEELMLHEKDIAVINMGEMHRIIKSEKDSKILFIQVDGCFFRNMLKDNRYLFIYCCSVYHEAEVPEKYEKLRAHIDRLIWMLSEKSNEECKNNIEDTLTTMLDYITYNFDFLRWGPGTVAFDEKHVERLKQIAEHINNGQTVSSGLRDLAEKVNISLHHLSHDIKDKFRQTFQQLLFYSRIEHAAKLLLSTDDRIIDISMECGFSDPKYLIKHFKQCFKYTPQEFRKVYRVDGQMLTLQAKYRDYPLSDAIKYLNSYKG